MYFTSLSSWEIFLESRSIIKVKTNRKDDLSKEQLDGIFSRESSEFLRVFEILCSKSKLFFFFADEESCKGSSGLEENSKCDDALSEMNKFSPHVETNLKRQTCL